VEYERGFAAIHGKTKSWREIKYIFRVCERKSSTRFGTGTGTAGGFLHNLLALARTTIVFTMGAFGLLLLSASCFFAIPIYSVAVIQSPVGWSNVVMSGINDSGQVRRRAKFGWR
jgi:hypothetical protein